MVEILPAFVETSLAIAARAVAAEPESPDVALAASEATLALAVAAEPDRVDVALEAAEATLALAV